MMRGLVLGMLCGSGGVAWLLARRRPSSVSGTWVAASASPPTRTTTVPDRHWDVNAAYGISDVFDLKFELLGSSHSYQPGAESPSERGAAYSAVAGLSYKLDVLQWIPYGAAMVGYQHIAGPVPVSEPFRRDDALLALVLGLDYAATRNFGLGLSFRTNFLLSTFDEGEAFTSMLRAEYHWGF